MGNFLASAVFWFGIMLSAAIILVCSAVSQHRIAAIVLFIVGLILMVIFLNR